MRGGGAVLTFVASMLAASIARADGDVEVAQRLFYEGRDALEKKDYAGACDKLGQSASLVPRPATLVNLADCEEHLGRVVSAEKHLRQAVGLLDKTDPRRAAAEERLAAVTALEAHVTAMLAPGSPATVTLDGASFDPRSTDVAIDPGKHVFVVSMKGREDAPVRFDIASHERKTVALAVGPLLPPPPPPPPKPLNAQRAAGYIAGVVGIVSLGTAIATGISLLSHDSRIRELCPTPSRCNSDEAYQLISGNKPILAINDVTWGLGVAGIGAGLVLILTSSDGSSSKSTGAMVHVGASF